MGIKIYVLAILHSYMIPEYNFKQFYTVFVHSYMIPEHFYTILNTFIQSWIVLCDPEYFFLKHFSVIKIIAPSKKCISEHGRLKIPTNDY